MRVAEPRKPAVTSEPLEHDPVAADEGRSRTTIAAWAVAFVALFGAAFFAERLFEPQPASPGGVEVIGARRPTGGQTQKPPAAPEAIPPIQGQPAQPSAARAGAADAAELPAERGMQIYNGILEPALLTAPSQGLLVIEATPPLRGAQLSVDRKALGGPPIKVALSAGTHELAITRGDTTIYRFVSVREGKTGVLREP
jgi:hypothetical protein